MKITILFSILFSLGQHAFAAPVLNKQFSSPNAPVSEPIFLDSEDPNIYWIHATEFTYCGLGDGKPSFAIQSLESLGTERTFVSFDLCVGRAKKTMDDFQALISEVNPDGKLKLIQAVYPQAPKIKFSLAKEFVTTATCIIPDGRVGMISCSTVGFTKESERFSNQFKTASKSALIATGYVKYKIGAVVETEPGKYSPAPPKFYQAVYYVTGLKEFF